MKALRVERLSGDLSGVALSDIPAPERAPGEVLVRVHAASLNYPDLLMTRGEYQFKPSVPFTSGLECAGEVIEADPDSGFAPGDRVIGGNKTGAFAEIASIPARSLSPLPDGFSFAQGAAMGAAYSTAYTGLVELCGLQQGQWVLVHGASGGVGLAACDLARTLGARVIAATGIGDKREAIAAKAAPDHVILAEGRFREAVSEITGGALADIVFDPVGGDVFDESTRCTAFAGKLVVVGLPAGGSPKSRPISRSSRVSLSSAFARANMPAAFPNAALRSMPLCVTLPRRAAYRRRSTAAFPFRTGAKVSRRWRAANWSARSFSNRDTKRAAPSWTAPLRVSADHGLTASRSPHRQALRRLRCHAWPR